MEESFYMYLASFAMTHLKQLFRSSAPDREQHHHVGLEKVPFLHRITHPTSWSQLFLLVESKQWYCLIKIIRDLSHNPNFSIK